MRISDWSSDVCSSDLSAADIFGEPVSRVAEIGERGERRPADAEHRAEIEEDRRAQPHFLGAGAQRNVDLEPPLVIGSAAQRVVDQLVAVDRRVEHRISRLADIDIGVADHARADAADVEAAQVRSEEQTSELQSLMRSSYAGL